MSKLFPKLYLYRYAYMLLSNFSIKNENFTRYDKVHLERKMSYF